MNRGTETCTWSEGHWQQDRGRTTRGRRGLGVERAGATFRKDELAQPARPSPSIVQSEFRPNSKSVSLPTPVRRTVLRPTETDKAVMHPNPLGGRPKKEPVWYMHQCEALRGTARRGGPSGPSLPHRLYLHET